MYNYVHYLFNSSTAQFIICNILRFSGRLFSQINDHENTKTIFLFSTGNLYIFTIKMKRILVRIRMHARLERTVLPDSVVPTASIQALYSARIGKHFYELTTYIKRNGVK